MSEDRSEQRRWPVLSTVAVCYPEPGTPYDVEGLWILVTSILGDLTREEIGAELSWLADAGAVIDRGQGRWETLDADRLQGLYASACQEREERRRLRRRRGRLSPLAEH